MSLSCDERKMVTDLLHTVLQKSPESINVLVLCQQAKALKVKDFVFGGVKSRYAKSSIVKVETFEVGSITHLAQIQYFMEINYFVVGQQSCSKLCVAAVEYFVEHPCKVWFGYPMEVWCRGTHCGIIFIPVKMIKSRVVYMVSAVNFGRSGTVMVITPIVDS